MESGARKEEERAHREKHAGNDLLRLGGVKIEPTDNCPTLLHTRTNCTCLTLGFITAGTTVAQRKEVNELLPSFSQGWSLPSKKGDRQAKPSGNESRDLLARKGLAQMIMRTCYASPAGPTLAASIGCRTDARSRRCGRRKSPSVEPGVVWARE